MADTTDSSVVRVKSQLKLTERQQLARKLLQSHRHTLLVGGSRSGKTTLLVHEIAARALRADNSRHAILRLHANAARASVALDTLPKVFRVAFPGERLKRHRAEGYFSLDNGSEIWIGGLGDQDQVEKILGKEYATIFLNECSQIPVCLGAGGADAARAGGGRPDAGRLLRPQSDQQGPLDQPSVRETSAIRSRGSRL